MSDSVWFFDLHHPGVERSQTPGLPYILSDPGRRHSVLDFVNSIQFNLFVCQLSGADILLVFSDFFFLPRIAFFRIGNSVVNNT